MLKNLEHDSIEHDSIERIESDLLELTKRWHDYDGNYMKIYSTIAYAQVKELLDRLAKIIERNTKLRELYRFEENHREQIRSIEEVNRQLNERIDKLQADLNTVEADNEYLRDELAELAELRPKRTIEDVLFEFGMICVDDAYATDEEIAKYATQIRELLGVCDG